jgi:hypothetical protein
MINAARWRCNRFSDFFGNAFRKGREKGGPRQTEKRGGKKLEIFSKEVLNWVFNRV